MKKISYYDNGLTALDLTNFSNLEEITFSNGQLNEIKFSSAAGEKLKILNLGNNNFQQDLSFLSGLVGLRELYLRNNKFKGSLEPLQDLNKLERLNISNVDIDSSSLKPLQKLVKLKMLNISGTNFDSGLEYLPESLKDFRCLVEERKDAKVKVIYNLFADEKREVETEGGYGSIKNFPQKLQTYKQKPQVKFEIEKILNDEKITDEQLTQQLTKDNRLTDFANT